MEKDCQNTETALEITNEWVNLLVYITVNIYACSKENLTHRFHKKIKQASLKIFIDKIKAHVPIKVYANQ